MAIQKYTIGQSLNIDPATKKPRKPAQGYKSSEAIATEAQLLLYWNGMYNAPPDESKPRSNPRYNDLTRLMVGQACQKVSSSLQSRMTLDLIPDMLKLAPDRENQGPQIEFANLKSMDRTAQKAVCAAVNEKAALQSAQPRIELVTDILRAKITLPKSYFEQPAIGSTLIDMVNDFFKQQVYQVKNRFIEGKIPNLLDWSGRKFTPSLMADIQKNYENDMAIRDSFYRDIMFLVKISSANGYDIGKDMDYVFFELQIVSDAPSAAKGNSVKAVIPGVPVGHKGYEAIRAVTEQCEYNYFWNLNKTAYEAENGEGSYKGPPFADANKYFVEPSESDWQWFTACVTNRASDYENMRRYDKDLPSAIDNSRWYKDDV